jgi:tetratricopeptide (TPR) repeat protein
MCQKAGKINWINWDKMARVNITQLLNRAESKFISGKLEEALIDYSLVLKEAPNQQDATVGVYLCDLGMESYEEAQALFEYYQAIKQESQDAPAVIETLIDSLSQSKYKLEQLLLDPIKEQVEYSDGIRYEDFLQLIEDRGNFKKAFEDIMFSTKVIITQKDEFIDFVSNLAKEGFEDMALGYLDATASAFDNDQDVLELYNLIKGKEE